MRIERKRNVTRNIRIGFISKFIDLFLLFILRTIVLHSLGIEYSGLDGLFSSILGFLSLSELGIGSILVYSMYKPIAEDDNNTILALLYFYRKCYIIIGSIIIVVGVILIPFIPYLIKAGYPQNINIYVVFFIHLVNTSSSYFLFAYMTSIFQAYQRNDIISKVDLITNILKSFSQIILLILLKNYYVYIIVLPITTILRNILFFTFAHKYYPQFCHNIDSSSSFQLKGQFFINLKKQVVGIIFHKLGNSIFLYADNIVISAILGLNYLGIYNYYYYVIMAVNIFMGIISNSLIPGIGNSLILNSQDKNRYEFNIINYFYYWLTTVISSCMLCVYQAFMKLWIGNAYLFDFSTVICFCILVYSLHINAALGIFKGAIGMWWEDKSRPILSATFNLFLNIILVNVIGINGVIISSFLANILIDFPILATLIFKKCFDEYPCKFLFKQFLNFIKAIIIVSISYYLTSNIIPESTLSLMMKLITCLVVSNVVFVLVNVCDKQSFEFYNYIRQKIK